MCSVAVQRQIQRQFIEAIDAFTCVLPSRTIEIAPGSYMRDRTLNRLFLVIDEAQYCTLGQVTILPTRLGWNSTILVTGDPDQTNLLPRMAGLQEISYLLDPFEDVASA